MMDKETKRQKHANYMRKYNQKNRERINAQRKERFANLSEEEREKKRELSRIRNRRYYEKHRDEINARAKARNWNYAVEKAKVRRKKYYTKNANSISISSARIRAKQRNLPFDLDVEWFKTMFKKGCAVTGLPLDLNGSKTPWTAHIDRIIPELGYTKENSRLVCACYNLAKKHWTDADVEKMARNLIRTSDA